MSKLFWFAVIVSLFAGWFYVTAFLAGILAYELGLNAYVGFIEGLREGMHDQG